MVLGTETNIVDNCFFGPTDADLGATAAIESTLGISLLDVLPTTTTIEGNSFNTLLYGFVFASNEGNGDNVFKENCFAYNNLAISIEEIKNFHDFGPNNLFNNQIDYYFTERLDDGTPILTTKIAGSFTPNPPAPAPFCSGSKKSSKLVVLPPQPFWWILYLSAIEADTGAKLEPICQPHQ